MFDRRADVGDCGDKCRRGRLGAVIGVFGVCGMNCWMGKSDAWRPPAVPKTAGKES